jgi:superfamily II DNA/RNA helicase
MPHYNQKRSGSYGRPQYSGRNKSTGRQPKKDYIHPSKFIQSAKPQTEEDYVPLHMFSDFKLYPQIQTNLRTMGFAIPSPIQDQTIPAGLLGRNIVGIANTGTGKTAAFAIPVLNRLIAESNSTALILAPTRELAQQIEEQCRQIAKGSGLGGAVLIGGMPMGPQLRELRNNPRIIIGTPGRIKDHLERRSLNLANCNIVVLDEVDRMLDMGFVNDIRHILGQTKPESKELGARGFSAGSIHGGKSQSQRLRALKSFKNNEINVLVATDVAARGLDVSDITHVINYSSPQSYKDYIHRIGRTGRAGKTGHALTFVER